MSKKGAMEEGWDKVVTSYMNDPTLNSNRALLCKEKRQYLDLWTSLLKFFACNVYIDEH